MTQTAELQDPIAVLLDDLAAKYPKRGYALVMAEDGQPVVAISEEAETLLFPLPFEFALHRFDTFEDVLRADLYEKLTEAALPSFDLQASRLRDEDQYRHRLHLQTLTLLSAIEALGYAPPTRVALGQVAWGERAIYVGPNGTIYHGGQRAQVRPMERLGETLEEAGAPRQLRLQDLQ